MSVWYVVCILLYEHLTVPVCDYVPVSAAEALVEKNQRIKQASECIAAADLRMHDGQEKAHLQGWQSLTT